MSLLKSLMASVDLAEPLPVAQAEALAVDLGHTTGMAIYPRSIAACGHVLYCLGRRGTEKHLCLLSAGDTPLGFAGESGTRDLDGAQWAWLVCPTSHTNACMLRENLPFTAPQPIGLRKSIGCGDRLGLATPGHVRAVRQGTMVPVFAQQSIREMTRTGRTPEQVLDDATWGVFQEGWRAGYGADADHLKTTGDVDRCIEAGFVMFTVDPGDHVDDEADADDADTLRAKFDRLPWQDLESSPADLQLRYLDREMQLGSFAITFDALTLWRAAAKYGPAVAHTARLYRHLLGCMAGTRRPFELEVSVDETETPTSPAEHYFVANELKRLGVTMMSLAPRFVGRFEKGVDYIGDLSAFEVDLARHVAVAHALGPYKISLHSGSDKFSLYPIAARLAGDLVHVKTAGTSYLEALRALARIQPHLFRDIMGFALQCYDTDRRSYHVSADPTRVPDPRHVADGDLPAVLDTFDGRQVLHVTFGSVLAARAEHGNYRFRGRLLDVLGGNEEAHYAALEEHIVRHVAPFG